MSIYKEALGKIIENKERKSSGGFNSIPFGLKKFEAYVPGILQSSYYIVTASSGVGKTKLAKNMFVFKPYDFVRAHPESGLKLSILYFCLEEPKSKFIQSAMCYKLRRDFSERISIKELNSQLNPGDPHSILDDSIINKVNLMEPYFKDFEKDVHIIDDVYNPYGIYRKCIEFLEENGDYSYAPKRWYDSKTKEWKNVLKKADYIPDEPLHYVVIVIDHISLIHPEKSQDIHEAIRTLSGTYLVPLKNKYFCSIVVIQQQSADKEKQQYTYKGASIESKLEPSLDGLADCKLTQRDADEVFGLFAPDRYEISDHRGYDVKLMKDNYRSLSILKSRDGEPNLRMGLLFDGATNSIWELKKPGDMTSADYKKALSVVGRTP